MMDHDFDAQREETQWVWNDLSAKEDLPNSAVIELQFVPGASSADWESFEKRLAQAGYKFTRYEDGSTLETSIGPIKLSFETIWHYEREATQMAIDCGFRPDGWGFFSN